MKEFIHNLKVSAKFYKGNGFKILLLLITTIIIMGLRIVTPILSAKTIVYLTDNKLKQVVFVALIILVIDIVWDLFWYLQRQLYHLVYRNVVNKVQDELGREILKISNKSLDANSSGLFIQRLTGDVGRVADVFEQLLNEISSIISSIGIIIAVFVAFWKAGIFVLFAVIVYTLISYLRVTTINKENKELKKEHEKEVGFIGELVRGSRDIKMLNSETSFLNKMSNIINHYNSESYRVKTINRNYYLYGMLTRDLLDKILVIYLVYLLFTKQISLAIALVIRNYQGRIGNFTDSIASLLETYKDFNLSCTRIFAIIDSDEFEKEHFGDKHLKHVNGDFEFKNVCFGYEKNQQVLNDLSFKVNANTTVGFVGKSGEGKSTIFSLLCKMYDIDKGEILIDGININELDKDSIRGNITIISQNPYIFNLSIKENLKLVKKNLTNKEMKEACKMACLDKFIESLPDKYDTIVGEGGVNLSGGQRQRLAIARAFVQKTEIILFDEATSALDNETQHDIQKAIENLQKDYTILIIAHRLSTIKNCDNIFLIDGGKVKAFGTHETLLKKSKVYRELYESEIEK